MSRQQLEQESYMQRFFDEDDSYDSDDNEFNDELDLLQHEEAFAFAAAEVFNQMKRMIQEEYMTVGHRMTFESFFKFVEKQ